MKRDKKLRKIFKNALIKKITKNNKLDINLLHSDIVWSCSSNALQRGTQLQGKKRASILSLFEKYP